MYAWKSASLSVQTCEHFCTLCQGANLETDEEVLTWGRDALSYFEQEFTVPIPEG